MARKYEKSIEQLRKMSEIEPTYAVTHYFLGFAYERQGKLPQAVEEFQRAVKLSGGDPSYLAGLAPGYALSGDQRQARSICEKLQKRARTEYVSSYDIALIYIGLRESNKHWRG